MRNWGIWPASKRRSDEIRRFARRGSDRIRSEKNFFWFYYRYKESLISTLERMRKNRIGRDYDGSTGKNLDTRLICRRGSFVLCAFPSRICGGGRQPDRDDRQYGFDRGRLRIGGLWAFRQRFCSKMAKRSPKKVGVMSLEGLKAFLSKHQ